MAQVTINNGDSGSTVRTALNGMFTELYGESNFPQVADYASLPVASSFSGATYEVLASTGTFLVNRKSAGLYRSNGTTWIYLGDINTDAATTGNTPAGNISATTVQAAINELDTEKAIAGAVTSSGLTMATGKLLGRSTASTGAIEELSTVPAANFPALTGDITTAGGALATTIGAGKVTLAMQANMATASLVYRKTAGSGAPEVNTLATLKTDLGLTGTNGGDQTITLTGDVTGSGTGSFAATIANSAVTLAKIANASASSKILGSGASGSGAAYVELSIGATLSFSGTTISVAKVPNAVTFDITGGAAAGSTFDGSATKTIDYSTVGARPDAPRIQSVSSASTVTPTFSNDQVNITALAAACQLLNPTGTAVPGRKLVVRIKDNGTARALTYDTQYRGTLLPTTTVISKTLYIGFIYNSTDTKWDCVAAQQVD